MSYFSRPGFVPRAIALAALTIAAGGATATQAQGQVKKTTANNGIRIYLSQACHNRGGPTCKPNFGCFGYNENAGSGAIAQSAARFLAQRGYTVKIGTGLTEDNIRDANAFGALIHIPIHSNAGTRDCGSTNPRHGGTLVMHYGGPTDDQLARIMAAEVGAVSPGTSDGTAVRRDLGEINQTTAHAAYLEAGYHTYGQDVTFLNNPGTWAYTIARAVDRCRGFPRNGPAPTRAKECSW